MLRRFPACRVFDDVSFAPPAALRRVLAFLLAAMAAGLLSGCNGVLDPRGPVGYSARLILFDSLAIMIAVVTPVLIAIAIFAWWFRAANGRAFYWPNWEFSGHLELLVWSIPALVVVFLGGIAWFGSQALDPFRPLESKQKPIEVQVVSLDWKWLFLYPEEGVASVNVLAVPVGVPVHFRLTSSGVMNSFFVPQLGSQIYSMAGMTSQLHLQADEPGTFLGISANFSGAGFSDMHFDVRSMPPEAYAKWVADAKASGDPLDRARYAELVKPSQNVSPITFRSFESGLFEAIVNGTAPQSQASSYAAPGGEDKPATNQGGG